MDKSVVLVAHLKATPLYLKFILQFIITISHNASKNYSYMLRSTCIFDFLRTIL